MGDTCKKSDVDISAKKLQNTTIKEHKLQYGAKQIVGICIPASISMSLVLIAIKMVPSFAEVRQNLPYVPFSENVPTTLHRTANSLLNALLFTVMVISTTVMILILYLYKCYRIINTWLAFTSFFLLTFFTFLYFKEAMLSFNYPVDDVTVTIGLWNFGIVGMVGIHWKAPKLLQQCYLIYIATLMALVFIKYLPDWSAWMILIILVIWDCLAVLSPNGPLRIFIETVKQRSDTIPPSLLYVSFADLIAEDENEETQADELLKTGHSTPGIKLGLGDFIFYGLLIGKVAKCGDWFVILSCYVGILVGLVTTTTLLSFYKRVMPALPISISLGMVIYFVSVSFLCRVSSELIKKQIFL
ncbi:presenilin-2-like protein [Leptotrombidium deliense]|uniref:Presenilin n=1 Tax=Leptotrombidium deliense TaxID=299467 RepID=A0A443S764_9ACAR|nr:presenilin-2-like protein [Leptotrombidium deliense]